MKSWRWRPPTDGAEFAWCRQGHRKRHRRQRKLAPTADHLAFAAAKAASRTAAPARGRCRSSISRRSRTHCYLAEFSRDPPRPSNLSLTKAARAPLAIHCAQIAATGLAAGSETCKPIRPAAELAPAPSRKPKRDSSPIRSIRWNRRMVDRPDLASHETSELCSIPSDRMPISHKSRGGCRRFARRGDQRSLAQRAW